ncbi:AraC family transcriptional regulator [Streptomyces sp. 8K308]|nr:AraC family transcriptional regulator [Streptomyces sp. 8K308]
MRAHFTRHVFHRHSHDAYSFAVTESGAQRFTCRGAGHTSGAGMVMAFNPDDPHDGESALESGFTYRIVHIGEQVVRDVLADAGDLESGRVAMPLFDQPVRVDPPLGRALLRLHHTLVAGQGQAATLAREERLTVAVLAVVRRGATHGPRLATPARRAAEASVARRAAALLAEAGPAKVTTARLVDEAGCSRFALYRAFQATYGMAPSDYQRLLRLRAARRLLADGLPPAGAATEAGFADQSHLHRWFVRCYGVTPARYQRAARG